MGQAAKKQKNQWRPTGQFTVGDKMRVSDPCYTRDVWCTGVFDCVPGRWQAEILHNTERVWELWVYLGEKPEIRGRQWKRPVGIEVGVDSAQCAR